MFSVNGKKVSEGEAPRKGKASYRLPKGKSPGKYKVSAKYKGIKEEVRQGPGLQLCDLALRRRSFTISKATPSYDLPSLTGSVKFKGKTAKGGYVDIYKDGKKKGGSSSPAYCCMDIVADNGTFDFSGSSFLGRVQAEVPGHLQVPGLLHRDRVVRRVHLLRSDHGDRHPLTPSH